MNPLNPPPLAMMTTGVFAMLANHLWQSTLFVVAAALLAHLCRRNRAHVRYWIWLTASLKFLIPVGLLIAAGNQLAWRSAAASLPPDLIDLVDGMTQPFTRGEGVAVRGPSPAAPSLSVTADLLPLLVLAIWVCGAAVVLVTWGIRWRRTVRLVSEGSPMPNGREIEILRRLSQAEQIARPLPLVFCAALVEPGVFGIARPVLLWPDRIGEWLTDPQIEAILAHELSHLRRRDNLTAVLHAIVQAVFWFYPVVWFVGGRLLWERERACDEAVVRMGSDPHAYAESILRTCEFSIGAPVLAAGVTGSNLTQRIEAIMNNTAGLPLSSSKKLLVATVLTGAVVLPLTFGVLRAAPVSAPTLALTSAPASAPTLASTASQPIGDLPTQDPPIASGTTSWQRLGLLDGRTYRHLRTGITFEVPSEWTFVRTMPSSDNGEMAIMRAQNPAATISVWMVKEEVLPANIGPWLDDAPYQKVRQRRGSYQIPGTSGYRLRPGTIERLTIGGHDAITAIAEYDDIPSQQAMAEYMTWIYTERGRTFCFARTPMENLDALRPQFDRMVQSAVIP